MMIMGITLIDVFDMLMLMSIMVSKTVKVLVMMKLDIMFSVMVMLMLRLTMMVMVMLRLTMMLWMRGAATASPDLVSNASKSAADIKIHPVLPQY